MKPKTISTILLFILLMGFLFQSLWFLPSIIKFSGAKPTTSTNYLFKDTTYNMTLEDVYDDADAYKLYTDSYFQSQYFNMSTLAWQDEHNESVDSGTDNNEVEYGSPSGDYEATYSFEGETGLTGTQISFVDTVSGTAGSMIIQAEKEGHNEVLYMKAVNGLYYKAYHLFSQDLDFGTVELWQYVVPDDIDWDSNIYFMASGYGSARLVMNKDGTYIWYNGVLSTVIDYNLDNQWNHLVFTWNGNNINVTVNEITKSATLQSGQTSVNRISFAQYDDEGECWFDAIGIKTGDYQSTESFDYTTEAGVYYGTYDFRDELGETGTQIDWIDTIAGTDIGYSAEVIAEEDGHQNIVKFLTNGDNGKYVYWMRNNPDQTADGTTIEFWMKYIDLGNGNHFFYISGDSPGAILFFFGFVASSNRFYWYYGNGAGGYTSSYVGASADVWYHIGFSIDFTNDNYDIYLNGVLVGDNKLFCNDGTATKLTYYRFQFEGFGGTNTGECYLDAVGESWDTTSHSGEGYDDIGWNYNPYDIEPILEDQDNSIYMGYGTTIRVLNLDGHQNVLELYDNSNSECMDFRKNLGDLQGYGTVEYWIRTDNPSLGTIYYLGYYTSTLIYIAFSSGYIRALDDTSYINLISANANQWYHIRIDFRASGGSAYMGLAEKEYYVYVDSIQYGSYTFYQQRTNSINAIRHYSNVASYGYSSYFDGLGCSWDSGYEIGDNLEPYDQEYEIGYNMYPDNINMIQGTYDYTDNMLILDSVLTVFTSTHTEGTQYESPAQFGDFTFTKGSSGVSGELETNNGVNYATLISSDTTYYPLSAEYIDHVTYTKGSGSGLLSNTQADDSNYYQLNSEEVYPYHTIQAELIFNPVVGGRDFYVSVHIESSVSTVFMGDGGTVFDYDNVIKNDVSSIQIFTLADNPNNVKIYYLKLNEVGITPAELDVSTTWNIPDSILTFYYDYRTNVSVDCDLDIYNYDTTGWLELKSATSTSFQTGSYALTDPYISPSNQVKIRFQTATYVGDFKIELDQLTVSYIDDPAELEFDISTLLLKYNRDLLSIHIESHQKTNISQQIYFKIWNYNTSSYDTISSSTETTSITKREFNSVIPEDYISGSGIIKLFWNGTNSEDDFIFSIDYLLIRICYKMNIWHEVAFDTNGLWRYRWEIHGSLEYTDWVQFEVVEPVPNFHAISESDVTTRWILQEADLIAVEDFHDDINTDYWNLVDVSDVYFNASKIATGDTKISSNNPNYNYGTSNFVEMYSSTYTIKTLIEQGNYIGNIYLLNNYTGFNQTLKMYIYTDSGSGNMAVYSVQDFSESTATWNNQPSTISYISSNIVSTGWNYFDIGDNYSHFHYRLQVIDYGDFYRFYSKEESGYEPTFIYPIYKNYFGSGYTYMQTGKTELISLKSIDYTTHYTLSSGDYFEVDFQTSSDSQINLILLKDGVVQKSLVLSQSGNTNFNRHTAQISVSESLEFDQLKISSTFEDKDYCKVFDIKTMKYTVISGDSEDFYVSPKNQRDVYLTPNDYNLKIYERIGIDSYDLREDFNLTIPPTDHYVFIPQERLQCRLTLYSTTEPTIPLTFENYHVEINRSYNNEYNVISLVEPIFYADVGSFIDINVKDRFDNLINSFEDIVADSYIELDIDVYQLEIINLMLQKTTININDTHIYELASGRWLDFMLAENDYKIEYYDPNNILQEFIIHLDSNLVVELNMSRICNLYYTNQKGEFLEFHQFKTYVNGTLLLQNVFYATNGEHRGIEVKDRYNISILNYTYVEGTEEYNQISLILTQYSLKLMNQQEQFNHINITRDPNYYESGYYWSEWIAPNEIIKFNLFAGYYKINLTDNENGAYSYYGYTLNGDDILLISSDNIISQVIYNIENVNVTLGNQITNVEINITNQNSQINQSIISVVINLENINSSLGDMLISLSVDIENINNNLTSLYMFTNTSFINLNNDMNNSFIYIENNIISINQSISNLVIGMQNDLWLINGSISTLIVDIGNDLLLMNTSIHTFLFALDVNLTTIGSNIDQYYILLNNSISLINSNVNDTRIAILNNLLLVNSSLSNLIMQVYDSVYLINNSIYTAVVDLGTYLSLINNSISGNLSIVLKRNEFLSAILQKTLFSEILNWTGANYNSSFIENQIDAWQFVNKYRDDACTVFLKYQDKIENLTVSAQNTLEQFLPKEGVEYRVWSESEQRYLDEWQPLPENRTVPFGFYEEEVPDIPNFNVSNTWLMIILIVFAFIGVIVFFGYLAYRYYQRIKRYKKANSLQANLNKNMIKDFSKGFSSGRRIK